MEYLKTMEAINKILHNTGGEKMLTKRKSDDLCKLVIIFIYLHHVVNIAVLKKWLREMYDLWYLVCENVRGFSLYDKIDDGELDVDWSGEVTDHLISLYEMAVNFSGYYGDDILYYVFDIENRWMMRCKDGDH